MRKPCVIIIAGFDPSAGAGILADIKTAESLGVYGLGVCSALTYQNDAYVESVDWIKTENIIRQVEVLSRRFEFSVAKIGLIRNWETLDAVTGYLLSENKNMKIIVDPILKASAGFRFHNKKEPGLMDNVLKKIFLLTPNLEEAAEMGNTDDCVKNAEQISSSCNVLLKGGHSSGIMSTDILFAGGKQHVFKQDKLENNSKHGSGCVLSSAIAAYTALGAELPDACALAKKYVTEFLKSEKGLIGYHALQVE